jgi:4-hydroxybenzoate polyprenyltransferase
VAFRKYLALCWREARPVVQVMFQIRFFAGWALSGAAFGGRGTARLFFGAAGWLCVTTVVYLLNGVSDVEADRRNGKQRPIARGELPLRAAWRAAIVTAACGLVLAALSSPWVLAAAAAVLYLGWLYSMGPRPAKEHCGGMLSVVGAAWLLTYASGWLASGGGHLNARLVVFAVGMVVWMGFAAMSKDLPDIDGDRAAGRRTWPVRFGEPRARLLVAATTVLAGAALAAAVWRLVPGVWAVGPVVAAGSLALAACLLSRLSQGSRRRRSRPYQTFMITQYAAHAIAIFSAIR